MLSERSRRAASVASAALAALGAAAPSAASAPRPVLIGQPSARYEHPAGDGKSWDFLVVFRTEKPLRVSASGVVVGQVSLGGLPTTQPVDRAPQRPSRRRAQRYCYSQYLNVPSDAPESVDRRLRHPKDGALVAGLLRTTSGSSVTPVSITARIRPGITQGYGADLRRLGCLR